MEDGNWIENWDCKKWNDEELRTIYNFGSVSIDNLIQGKLNYSTTTVVPDLIGTSSGTTVKTRSSAR